MVRTYNASTTVLTRCSTQRTAHEFVRSSLLVYILLAKCFIKTVHRWRISVQEDICSLRSTDLKLMSGQHTQRTIRVRTYYHDRTRRVYISSTNVPHKYVRTHKVKRLEGKNDTKRTVGVRTYHYSTVVPQMVRSYPRWYGRTPNAMQKFEFLNCR